ncbi:hypothetical protein K525DRAFT_275383 [Schizophyllum commune Loenen D]|nr:hypothetical protein K525DRAFT_275383 [Schizophyllum commune Loenen D]
MDPLVLAELHRAHLTPVQWTAVRVDVFVVFVVFSEPMEANPGRARSEVIRLSRLARFRANMLSDELPDKIVACEKRPGHDHSTPSIHYLRRMYFPMYHDKQLDPETLLITMTDDEGL